MKLVKALGPYALRRRWVRRMLRENGLRVADIRSQISNGGLVDSSDREFACSGNSRVGAMQGGPG